jgi:hypothetical protein
MVVTPELSLAAPPNTGVTAKANTQQTAITRNLLFIVFSSKLILLRFP